MERITDEMAAEIERIDAGGTAVRDDDEVIEVEIKRPLVVVAPVRLSADDWRALRREAAVLGIGPTTLARMWLLEKLREKSRVRR